MRRRAWLPAVFQSSLMSLFASLCLVGSHALSSVALYLVISTSVRQDCLSKLLHQSDQIDCYGAELCLYWAGLCRLSFLASEQCLRIKELNTKKKGKETGIKGEESERNGGFCLCCLWNCSVINQDIWASTDRHVKHTTITIQDMVF